MLYGAPDPRAVDRLQAVGGAVSCTSVEVIPRRAHLPTCGELRDRLPGALVAVHLRTGERRACPDTEPLSRGGAEYRVEVDGAMVTAMWVGRSPDDADLDAVGEAVGSHHPGLLASWRVAGFSIHVAVLANPAWRELARALLEVLDGVLVVDMGRLDLVGLSPGIYTVDEVPAGW